MQLARTLPLQRSMTSSAAGPKASPEMVAVRAHRTRDGVESSAPALHLVPTPAPWSISNLSSTEAVPARPVVTRPARARVSLIDSARGLFLFWMIVAHALGLVGVRNTSPLAFLIPPQSAWLSERFVVLSGFTVAWVFAASALSPLGLTRKLWRRALQIGGIAYVSNVASSLAIDAMAGHLTLASVLEPAVLSRPWSISWVLLPTTVLLILAPGVLLLAKKISAPGLFVAATVLGFIAHGPGHAVLEAASSSHVAALAYLNVGSLVGIVVLGLWGLTLALVVRNRPLRPFAAIFGAVSLCVLLVGTVVPVPHFLCLVFRFGAFFGAATLLFATPGLCATRAPLELLGRNALLVFIAHRYVEQMQNAIFATAMDPQLEGVVIAVSTVGAMLCACHYKETHPTLAARLKRVGL